VVRSLNPNGLCASLPFPSHLFHCFLSSQTPLLTLIFSVPLTSVRAVTFIPAPTAWTPGIGSSGFSLFIQLSVILITASATHTTMYWFHEVDPDPIIHFPSISTSIYHITYTFKQHWLELCALNDGLWLSPRTNLLLAYPFIYSTSTLYFRFLVFFPPLLISPSSCSLVNPSCFLKPPNILYTYVSFFSSFKSPISNPWHRPTG